MERRMIIHEGFLKKSPPEHKIEKNYKWHTRFFRLWSDRTLEYYKEVEKLVPIKEPIDLRQCENAAPDDEEHYKKFGKRKWAWFFKLKTPERTYHFIASSKAEMDLWILHINNLCMDVDIGGVDMIDAMVVVDGNTRSGSISSRSAWSTNSSSSTRSSPGVGRISPLPTTSIPIQDQSTRSRIVSIPHDYRIPRSPQRSSTTGSDPRDSGYDVLVTSPRQQPETVYHVPPEPKPKPATKPHSPLTTAKQPLTNTRIEDNSVGYVQMTPIEIETDPYLPMDAKLSFEPVGPSPGKVFKKMPFISSSVSSRSQTLPQRPTKNKQVVMDEIPDLTDKKRINDLKEDAPKVNRTNKPAPIVDRAKKPSTATLPPRLKLSSPPLAEHELVFHIGTDTDDGMSQVLRYSSDDPLCNYSTPSTNHQSSPTKISRDNLYLNQTITRDSRGHKITVGESVHINLNNNPPPPPPLPTTQQIDYSREPLPPSPSPYENSVRKLSSASNTSDVSYVNDDAFEDGLHYKSYENVNVQPTNRVLRYSEVDSDQWMHKDDSTEASAAANVDVSDDVGATGTHYVLVDTTKSDAVTLTLRDRRGESKQSY